MSSAADSPTHAGELIGAAALGTRPRTRLLTRARTELLGMFSIVFAINLLVGVAFIDAGIYWTDAAARSQNALDILFGSDPHLAALGFTWMPLPVLMELVPSALYPIWPSITSSGFTAAITTATTGALTATLLLFTARKLGLGGRLAWLFALLFALNPMILLYSSNGLSEGVAAPFLTGSVCFVVLFWQTRSRRYVVAAGLALALGFSSLYEAVPFGAALFAALVTGLLVDAWSNRKEVAPRGLRNAVAALGTLLLLPSVYVGALWVLVNKMIKGDPFYFAHGIYSNAGQTELGRSLGYGGAFHQAGDLLGTVEFVLARVWPFLIPVVALLLIRALDRRLLQPRTLVLLLLVLIVPVGLIGPFVYRGESFGWLRFFMYPLFVAGAWGLYELAQTQQRRRAAIVLACGWVFCAPAVYWAMTNSSLGQEEHRKIGALFHDGGTIPEDNFIRAERPAANWLKREMQQRQGRLLVGNFAGYTIRQQMPPDLNVRFMTVYDRRFSPAIKSPTRYGVTMVLLPSPHDVLTDEITAKRARAWAGRDHELELIGGFRSASATRDEWRLFSVRQPVRSGVKLAPSA